MDKETLSNYGWIVICILVLSVMIALATPFGNYVSNAVKSTTKGLNDTSDKAMSVVGLNGKGEWDDSGSDTTEIKREAGSVIPDGATYTPSGKTTLVGNGTNKFPNTPSSGDTYEEGDYIYTYDEGQEYQREDENDDYGTIYKDCGTEWSVVVKDKTKTQYGEILSEIAGKPMTHMVATFEECESLIISPSIPNSVVSMEAAFACCISLTTMPTIPNSVNNMLYAFFGCESLDSVSVIPNSVVNMEGIFTECYSLTIAPIIPNSVTHMHRAFGDCVSLKTYVGNTDPDGDFSNYKLPNGITNMNGTFRSCKLTYPPVIPQNVTDMHKTFEGCEFLIVSPNIPNGVTNMEDTFSNCTSLTTAPTIPNGVTDMSYTFRGCASLTTAPTIPSGVTNMYNTFYGCTSLITAPKIPSRVVIMDYTFENCTSLTGTITIDANPPHFNLCFKGTTKPIILTGTSTMLSELATTSTNGNVTVK